MVRFVVRLRGEEGGEMVVLVVALVGKGGRARARMDGRVMRKVRGWTVGFILRVVEVVKVVKDGRINLVVGIWVCLSLLGSCASVVEAAVAETLRIRKREAVLL